MKKGSKWLEATGYSTKHIQKHLALIMRYWEDLDLFNKEDSINLQVFSSTEIKEPVLQAGQRLMEGIYKCQNGNILNGRWDLADAEKQLRNLQKIHPENTQINNLLAYNLCEAAYYHYLMFDMKSCNYFLEEAKKFAHSEKMNIVVQTHRHAIWHNRFYMDVLEGDLGDYDLCLEILRKHEIHYALILGLYHRMGVNIKLDLIDQTLDNYFEGIELCKKTGWDSYLAGFQQSLGIWYANHKEWQKAIKCYEEAYVMSENLYRRALCLENTASLYERYDISHQKRITVLKKLLAHCEKYGIIQKIPVICLYLAEYYLQTKQNTSIGHKYFKKGYEAALKMQEQGINLFSRAARIVKEYPEFLEKYQKEKNKQAQDEDNKELFERFLDKEWAEIKMVFQYSFFSNQRRKSADNGEFLEKMKLKPRTMHVIRNRFLAAGYKVPDYRFSDQDKGNQWTNTGLNGYCNGLDGLDWEAANRKFQNEVLAFLIKHFQGNKMQLSKVLKLSYPTMITLLKNLKSEIEH